MEEQGFKFKINENEYGPYQKEQTIGLLKMARRLLSGTGIYALGVQDEIILKNELYETKEALNAAVEKYKQEGFKVLWKS